ncbi:MAG: hypothetical protein IAF08_12035 [Rhizobacter sp.]|nr:hypothetical protein [Chlorobiales bacterium]
MRQTYILRLTAATSESPRGPNVSISLRRIATGEQMTFQNLSELAAYLEKQADSGRVPECPPPFGPDVKF